MSTDVLAAFTNAPHTQTQLASTAYPSGEGHDGSVIPKERIQAISICPSGKDDAQILSTSSTDEKLGIPNDVTCRATDQSTRMVDECLEERIDDLNTRVKKLESGAARTDSLASPDGNPTRQIPMAVVTPNDNNPAQKDEETNPPRHPVGTTQDPSRSNPTTSDKGQTAWIVFCVILGIIVVYYLLQTVYTLHINFSNLRNSPSWCCAVRDWCFASDTCRTKVSALMEVVDVVVVTILALCDTVQTMWFHTLDTTTPWLPYILWAETILFACFIYWPTFWRSILAGKWFSWRQAFRTCPIAK